MKIVFMGTPKAAVPSLERILRDLHEVVAVYTQPDRPAGRGNKIAYSPVKEFALKHNLPVFQPIKIKTPEALEEFKSHSADVAVVVAYGRILPEAFLNAFPKGAINVHFSLLPKYRGAAPVSWAIAQGETITGVTTIQMDVGLDTGDILMTRATTIGVDETTIDVMKRLSLIGADLLSETLAIYGEIVGQPQNHDEASFAPMMKREDGLINWEMTAAEISNRVSGFQPFPSSFTYFRARKLTIWKSRPISSSEFQVSNEGEVLEAKNDNLILSCGERTLLKIEELQIEGKRRVSTRDFLNGIKVQIGEKFWDKRNK